MLPVLFVYETVTCLPISSHYERLRHVIEAVDGTAFVLVKSIYLVC